MIARAAERPKFNQLALAIAMNVSQHLKMNSVRAARSTDGEPQ
jgi:hypothetical protein